MTEQQHDAVKELTEAVHRLTVKVETYSTIVGQHIQEQRSVNAHLLNQVKEHEQRVRQLEEWRAVKDATLPKRWLDAEEIEDRMEELSDSIDSIKLTLAKWAGIGVAAITAVEIAFQVARLMWG